MENAIKLPDVLPGHWETDEGSGMAKHYLADYPTRHRLCGGRHSDMAIARDIALLSRNDLNFEPVLSSAKDRIRWLSAQLAVSQAALARLGSMEAFDVATANVSKEEKMRIDFARAHIIKVAGAE